MLFTASKIFNFSACHKLVNCQSEECKQLHGHNYRLEVEVCAHFLNRDDMVIDFKKLTEIVNPIVEKFDHSDLNNYFPNPTAEITGMRIYNSINTSLPEGVVLKSITLWETDKCKIKIQGD